jgi:hypothetical protein
MELLFSCFVSGHLQNHGQQLQHQWQQATIKQAGVGNCYTDKLMANQSTEQLRTTVGRREPSWFL